MSNSHRDLGEHTLQLLERDASERQSFIREDYWVGYPDATRILRRLEEVALHPPSTRMPSIAIVGRSNNGKTSLIERFSAKHQPQTIEDGVRIPVVRMRMPSNPDESKLWTVLLTGLMVSHRPNSMARALHNQATRVLREIRTKILIIDEFHHLISSSSRQQEQVLAALKNLSTDLSLSLIAVGTRELIGALRVDPQMTSRFEPYGLKIWALDKSFQRLLASIERHLPLQKQSRLASSELATEIFRHSEGTIGGITKTIRLAADTAIASGEEAITIDIVKSLPRMTATEFAGVMKKI